MIHACLSRFALPCLLIAAALAPGCTTTTPKPSAQFEPLHVGPAPSTAPATRPTPLASKVFNFNDLVPRPSEIGEQRPIFRSPTATLDELEIHITTLKPGMEPHPPHQHPYEEMVLLKEGTLQVTINGRTSPMTANSVMFFAPNDLHGWHNTGTTPATYWVITWRTPRTAAAN